MLTVYIDFKSPNAYLAMKPTLALAERLDVTLDWRPFRSMERDVPKEGTDESVSESHRRVRAASKRALQIKYAKHQGIDLRFPNPLGHSDLALGTLATIEGDPLPYIQACFSAYWKDHQDLDDEAVVARLIEDSGATLSANLSEARALLDTAQDQAEEAGIVDAPAYVIGEHIFVGREHLPWIEELLATAV